MDRYNPASHTVPVNHRGSSAPRHPLVTREPSRQQRDSFAVTGFLHVAELIRCRYPW